MAVPPGVYGWELWGGSGVPNSSVNQALGAQWRGDGFLLFSQEERNSGVNPALASNLKIEEKSLARVLSILE